MKELLALKDSWHFNSEKLVKYPCIRLFWSQNFDFCVHRFLSKWPFHLASLKRRRCFNLHKIKYSMHQKSSRWDFRRKEWKFSKRMRILFSPFSLFLIGGWLIDNVVLISGVYHSESINLHIHGYPLCFRFFSHVGHHRVLRRVSCAIVGPY